MNHTRRMRDGEGFTLVELLTAIILLTLVLLPALSAIRTSFHKSERRLQEVLEAQLILRSALADMNMPRETTVMDTVSCSGFRYRLINQLIPAGSDTERHIAVMIQRGASWDTLAKAITPQFCRTPVLLR